MHIPLCNIRASDAHYRKEIDQAIKRVIDGSNFILGEEVGKFEHDFAEWLGVKYCVGVSSCTMALYLALRALEVGPEDEVLVPDFTIAANIEAVLMCGATPVICGVKEDGCVDETEMINTVNPKTRAAIAIHLYGHSCDMEKLKWMKIPVIEDCAQSTGTEYRGKKTGTFGTLSCFSFFPSKNLGAYGDGGMIATDSPELYELCYMLRNHGRGKGERYKHSLVGTNSRLNGIQAAILGVKLKYLDEAIEKKRGVADMYDSRLSEIEQITTPPDIPHILHSFYMYSIRCENRDALLIHLRKCGIKASVHYPMALSQQLIYKKYYRNAPTWPTAYKLAESVLSLPIYPGITEVQVDYVCRAVKEFYG